MADHTRTKVLSVASDLGYEPVEAARALITGRTKTVALVVPDVENPIFPELITAAQQQIQSLGYRMLLLNARFGDAEAQVNALRGGVVDGVLFATSAIESPAVREAVSRGLPTALMIRGVESVPVDTFIADDAAGCELVADLLDRLGHRRIGLLSGPTNTTSGRDRERLFREALRRRNIPLPRKMVRHGRYSFGMGVEGATRLIGLPDRPSALFCTSDVIAFGALHALREKGLRVPEDVSVVGFDDVALSSWNMVALTTVQQPIARIAEEAVSGLVDRIEGRNAEPAALRIFNVELVERATTGPAPKEF